jgi:hypothetical protein
MHQIENKMARIAFGKSIFVDARALCGAQFSVYAIVFQQHRVITRYGNFIVMRKRDRYPCCGFSRLPSTVFAGPVHDISRKSSRSAAPVPLKCVWLKPISDVSE